MSDERPDPEKLDLEVPLEVHLGRLARELATIRQLVSAAVISVAKAEDEVPENVRRFVTYMHDVHDISYMYEERGLQVPAWIHREMERCDDRFRQILAREHAEGETFAKVRAEMAEDKENKWDHTRLLAKPKET